MIRYASTLLIVAAAYSADAGLIAGVNFQGPGLDFNLYDRTPLDLDEADGITVSPDWYDLATHTVLPTNSGLVYEADASANAYAGAHAGLMQTTTGIYFSITIPDTVLLDLTNISFYVNSAATSYTQQLSSLSLSTSVNPFWIETTQESLPLRAGNSSYRFVDVDFTASFIASSYVGLTDTTVEFHFFTQGTEVDIDTILINGDVTQVPEPSSLALLGLGGLLIARRRRG